MGSERRGQVAAPVARSSAPWVPSQGPQPLHFQRQAPTNSSESPRALWLSPSLSRSFTSPSICFSCGFSVSSEDSQILIGASIVELGDPDPDSVLRILLLEARHTGRHKAEP